MKNHLNHELSRRNFLKCSSALAAVSLLPAGLASCTQPATQTGAAATPSGGINSDFGGVKIGTTTYSWRDMPNSLNDIISYCHEANIGNLELMGNVLEEYLGKPDIPYGDEYPMLKLFGAAVMGFMPFTDAQKAEIEAYSNTLREWRLSVPMEKVEQARKVFNDAGISIHILNFTIHNWSDEELDYGFRVAKTMGAMGLTAEIGEEAVRMLAPFAEKHGIYAIFHNHGQFGDPSFSVDPFLALSPNVMLNFDAGHYFGSNGKHPNDFIQKYHERIYSIHLKDKTGPDAEQPDANQVWGQGQTPLEDILLLIKKEKWPIHCDIELEYEVKPWSTSVKEVGNCVNYARQILL